MARKTALITGATSGFGEAIAFKLSENGWNLILTGRRQDRLDSIKQKLFDSGCENVLTSAFDIRNESSCHEALQPLLEKITPDVLVNNAGLALGLTSIDAGDTEDWDTMIDTNVKGLLYLTRMVAPIMKRAGSGHIINISSVAGKEVYPGGNVYCATKHAVDALTRSMRMELYESGIKVSSVSPGAAETEFSIVRFKGNEAKAKSVYQGFDPLTAEDIADTVYYILSRPPHVNIADILILPAAQGAASMIKRKK